VNLEVFRFFRSDRCPATATCLASMQALPSRRVSSASKLLGGSDQGGQTAPERLDRPRRYDLPPRQLNWPGWPHLLVESSASILWLNRVTQWFSGEELQTPRTRCSLYQSPLMTRLPHSFAPRLENRRWCCSSSRLVWPVWPVRSTGLTGVRRHSRESSKQRTRVGIARLAPWLSSVRPPGIRPMEKI
jgi:hypothetical protein